MEQPDHRSKRRDKRDRQPQQERTQHAAPTRRTASSTRRASTAKESGAQPPARDSSPLSARPPCPQQRPRIFLQHYPNHAARHAQQRRLKPHAQLRRRTIR